MKLKTRFKNNLPLVDYFVSVLNSSKGEGKHIHEYVLKKINGIEEFDKQIGLLNFEAIDFENSDDQKNQESFIKLINLINTERKKILKYFNKKEVSNYISKPQKRIARLTEEAFVLSGDSKTKVKQNENEYSLIF